MEDVVHQALLFGKRDLAEAEIGVGGGAGHRKSSFVDRTIARQILPRYVSEAGKKLAFRLFEQRFRNSVLFQLFIKFKNSNRDVLSNSRVVLFQNDFSVVS